MYYELLARLARLSRANLRTAGYSNMMNDSNANTVAGTGRTGATVMSELTDFGLIRFGGDDAQTFLHGQFSCDVASLQTGHAQYGSYNSAQGRMLATFLLWRDSTGYLMLLPKSLCAPIRKRLAMYILRSKVKATEVGDETGLLGVAGADARSALSAHCPNLPGAALTVASTRDMDVLQLAADRYLVIAPAAAVQRLIEALEPAVAAAPARFWNWLDIRAGIAWITPETQDQFVPQMANLDLIGGISFKKGCYPGQEIVARMHYLGRLKQRMYLANIVADQAPPAGTKLYSPDFGEQACGMIVSVAPAPQGGHDVLAVIQTASAERGDVHCQSPAGPALNFQPLPYQP
jgi:tRNA-modifying protein YgfZ